MSVTGEVAGYAFLSYAREDEEHVDQLQKTLEAAGIPVWRDIRDLQPGQDWKLSIRRAVSEDAMAFLACFSKASQGKPKGYQNEELWLAAEQFRLRPPGRPWLIPVRFDDCAVPDVDLGGGRTLASLQRADLFGETRADHATRLINAILQILGPGVTSSAQETLDRRVAVAEAVAALREAVRLDPRYAYAHRRLGAALLDQGDYTEAKAAEREAIRLDPDNAFAHSRLGEALRLQGRLAEAVVALREAVRLDPGYAYAHADSAKHCASKAWTPTARPAARCHPHNGQDSTLATARMLAEACLSECDDRQEFKSNTERVPWALSIG